MAPAPGRGGRTGGPEAQRRAVVQAAGAHSRRRRPGGEDLEAAGLGAWSPGLSRRRSERESKTGPGSLAWAALSRRASRLRQANGAARNWPFKKTFRARRSRPGPAPRTL
ncbi:uncharacterized protein V5649_008008 [Rhynchonycteris naso]